MLGFTERLLERKNANHYRVRTIQDDMSISFASNNYLGLANHPQVVNAFKSAADKYGVGSGASHLLGGYSNAHIALEEELAEFAGYPRVLVFSTGYMANLGVLTALLNKNDLVFEDKHNHASLIDAGKFSGAQFKRYLHCNVQALEKQIKQAECNNKYIISDGVFSMDGDTAPLKQLRTIADKFSAILMIDDAHGLGVLGEKGGGISEHFVIKPDILVGTFGKAFGTFGAFVASSEVIIENLIQFARTYIYTTALPSAIAEATRVSLRLLQSESWRRERLNALIHRFWQGARQLDLPLQESITPIQPIIIGDAGKVMGIYHSLREQGIVVGAIRPPTVAPNTARLRISLSAIHTEKQIDQLLDKLRKNEFIRQKQNSQII